MRRPKATPSERHEHEQESADADGKRCEDGAAPVVVVPKVTRKKGVHAGEDEGKRHEDEEDARQPLSA